MKLKYVASAFIMAFVNFARADFTEAMINYQEKKYPEAMEEFKRLASLGNKDSQFNIGVMNYRGEGVDRNSTEAYAWMTLSAESGNEDHAKMRDAVQKKLTDKEMNSATVRYQELAKQFGDSAIQKKLSPQLLADDDCIFKNELIQSDKPIYPKKALKANLVGSVDISYDLDENGFARNYAVIVATNSEFSEPALRAMSNFRYKPYMISGKSVPVIDKKIRIIFRISNSSLDKQQLKQYMESLKEKATSGTAHEKYIYAYMMEIVPEIKYQKQEINEWIYEAAKMGHRTAQYQLGRSLLYGEGCVADSSKALEWLTLSARSSGSDSQYFLGASLISGSLFERNKKQALELLNHAAAAKNSKAIVKLAWIYSTDTDANVYNPKRALELINSVFSDYEDRLSATETLAAAQSANQLFDEAVETQKNVVSIAENIKNMPTDIFKQRLVTYQNHQPWREQN